jgi:hypothetical protein
MRRGQPRKLSFRGDPGGARRRPLLRVLGSLVYDAPFHSARDRHDLTGDVSRQQG